jgi:hypothetical protein
LFLFFSPSSQHQQSIQSQHLITQSYHLVDEQIQSSKSSPTYFANKQHHHHKVDLKSHFQTQTTNHKPQSINMPVAPKSYLPAFTAFLALGITYTIVVASKEGAAVDGARTRWQGQHASARRVLSGGMTMEEMQSMGTK